MVSPLARGSRSERAVAAPAALRSRYALPDPFSIETAPGSRLMPIKTGGDRQRPPACRRRKNPYLSRGEAGSPSSHPDQKRDGSTLWRDPLLSSRQDRAQRRKFATGGEASSARYLSLRA